MGKRTLTDHEIAFRVCQELEDGDAINLGIGIASLVSGYVPKGIQVTFHVENGIIGFGKVLSKEEVDKMDFYVVNAGAQFIEHLPGMCVVDFAESFDAVRNGRVNVTVLGAYQVAEYGDFCSWTLEEHADKVKLSTLTLGGAMDMPVGPKKVIIAMRHVDKKGDLRILKKCSFPLTARRKATTLITDVAVIKVSDEGLELIEVAPGWTPDEIQAITEPTLKVSPSLKTIDLSEFVEC